MFADNARNQSANNRGSSPMRQRCDTVDLLVVGEEDEAKTGLNRGFSIRLVKPPAADEEESKDETSYDRQTSNADAPKYYYSLSNISMGSQLSFGTDNVLHVPLDPNGSQPYQNVPIHRTESRLPSLDTMLADEELRRELFSIENNQILHDFSVAILYPSAIDRFRGLNDLLKKTVKEPEYSVTTLDSAGKQNVVETVCLLIRQELAKHVDTWRYLTDQRKDGRLSRKEFHELLAVPDYQVCIEPWAFISLGLKMLRNFCTTPEIQELIHAHRLADLIVSRRKLLFTAVMQADAAALQPGEIEKLPFIEEVRKNLVRTVATFLTNLVTNNMIIQTHLWRILWPHGYWSLLLLAGQDNYDYICFLLHNHVALWMQEAPPGSAPDSPCRSLEFPEAQLEAGMFHPAQNNTTIEPRIARKQFFEFLGSETTTTADFGQVTGLMSFVRALLTMPLLIAVEQRQTTKIRQHQSTPIPERTNDWLILLMVKLMCFGNGAGIVNLINYLVYFNQDFRPKRDGNVMDLVDPPQSVKDALSDSPFARLVFIFSFPPVSYPLPIEAVGVILKIAAKIAEEPPETRRWPQKFVNKRTLDCILRLYVASGNMLVRKITKNDALARFSAKIRSVAPAMQIETKEPPTEDKGAGQTATPHALEPCVRMLSAMAAFPGLTWDEKQQEDLAFSLTTLLQDILPLMQEHLVSSKQSGGEKKQGEIITSTYGEVMKWISCKSVLLLLTNLVSQSKSVAKSLKAEVVLYGSYSSVLTDLDPGASEAAILLLRILEDHPNT